MKLKTLKEEFKQMTKEQLEMKIEELRRELLTLRLKVATQPVKSLPSDKKFLRRSIACGLTLLAQR
jgi:ribosomal protein L29